EWVYGRLGLPWAHFTMAALFVACVARHTALLSPCLAAQDKPILPYTHSQAALNLCRSLSGHICCVSLQASDFPRVQPEDDLHEH
ncbi:hypothetical protein RY831_28305, partial [Noviherbaspirillum sp. CPCC 100848]